MEETEVVRRCLEAIVLGPFISDGVFVTLLGFERGEIQERVESWEDEQPGDDTARRMIKNVLNTLTSIELVDEKTWDSFIPVSPKELTRIYYRWKNMKMPEFSWDGEVKGVFSKKARACWDRLYAEEQSRLMSNVFCESCGQKTLISGYEAHLDIDSNILIMGMCTSCGAPVELLVDVDAAGRTPR